MRAAVSVYLKHPRSTSPVNITEPALRQRLAVGGSSVDALEERLRPHSIHATRSYWLHFPRQLPPDACPGRRHAGCTMLPATSLFKLAITWPFGQRRRTTPPCLRTSHRNVITHSLATFYPYMPQVVASSNPSLIVIAPSSGHPNCLRGVKCVRARAAGACAGTRHCPLSDTDTQSVFRKSAF